MSDQPAEEGAIPVSEWSGAFVPLGTYSEEAWSPRGAGVLIVDLPVVWLVTSKSLVRDLGEEALAAFLSHGEGGTILDLSESHAKSGLGWIEHGEQDVIASVFPMNPAWGIKAFSQQQCAPVEELRPLLPVCSLGCPYGLLPVARPEPFLLTGSIGRLRDSLIYSTAPLLANNVGGPLVLASGLGGPVKLIGVLTASHLAPEADPRVPPVRVSEAVGMNAVWDLVRGEQALAQRKRVSEIVASKEAR